VRRPTPADSTIIGTFTTREVAGYPHGLEREATLKNGVSVRIRPIRPDDEPRLVALYSRLSSHTRYQRFFSATKRLPPNWFHFFANVDYRRRMAFVAEHNAGPEPELLGVGRYESTEEEGTAEVALVVQDDWQDKGLGTILLSDLLQAAVPRSIRQFRAYVLSDNHRMLSLLSRLTNVRERKTEGDVISLVFVPQGMAISTTPERETTSPSTGTSDRSI
jgi:GNAT superfamily N-acetyltransferase